MTHFTFTSRSVRCLSPRIHVLHFAQLRDKHEVLDTRIKCNEPFNALFRENVIKELATNSVSLFVDGSNCKYWLASGSNESTVHVHDLGSILGTCIFS